MCTSYEQRCSCGIRSASFHFKDSIMPEQVIRNVYCPVCSSGVAFDPGSMIVDNGWIIEYDMDIAVFKAQKPAGAGITPDYLFDGELCTWNGLYPGDHADSVKEREALVALSKTDPLRYLREIKEWALQREDKLKAEGWRKALNGGECT
ncbi:MAG: hypothetical protein M1353_11570 [Nitrospirae bacterium]|nr:hypothetical protein [Nitrospirota bacterium]